MVASWHHQVPIFFLHRLSKWSATASEGGELYRMRVNSTCQSCATCVPVEDIASILSVSRCCWSSFRLTCVPVHRNGKRMFFQPSLSFILLKFVTTLRTLLPTFHWPEFNHMASYSYKGIWDV